MCGVTGGGSDVCKAIGCAEGYLDRVKLPPESRRGKRIR